METIKIFIFACLVLSLLTGSRCSFSSSFSSDDDDDDDEVVIVVSNAETTSIETVESLTQTLLIADVASQSSKYIDSFNALTPSRYTCANVGGMVSINTNNANKISIKNNLLLSYINCSVDNVIVNGDLTISLLDTKGIDIGRFDSGTDWLYSINVKADSLKLNTGSEAFTVDSDMIITIEFDATSAELKAAINSDSLSIDNGSENVLSDIDISQSINLAVMPSSYTLSVNSLKILSDTQNGTIHANTEANSISGMELLSLDEYFVDLHSPENGRISISGKHSNAEVSIMPDQLVTIDVDTDGDSITNTVINSTWSQIQFQ